MTLTTACFYRYEHGSGHTHADCSDKLVSLSICSEESNTFTTYLYPWPGCKVVTPAHIRGTMKHPIAKRAPREIISPPEIIPVIG